ncbi:hypothetical protein [Streptomyces sp. NPDC055189]
MLSVTAHRWWAELACDAQAVRAGGPAVAAMWNADLAKERSAPLACRIRRALWALRGHPPMLLRRAFARRVPLPVSASGHPLSAMSRAAPASGSAL